MRWNVLAVLAVLLLAGCSSKGDGKGGEDLEDLFEVAEVGTGKGLIRGIVLDASLTPVPGATVKLVGQEDRTTDGNGIFVFSDLDPGTYFLQASKPGWTEVQQSVDVQADVAEPPIVKVSIERIPGAEPRAETLVLDGYISCSAGTPVSFHDCNTVEEQRSRVYFPIQGRPQWVQTELIWDSTQAAGDWLYVVQGVCACADGEVPDVGPGRFDETPEATSPYIARATPDFLADQDAGGENLELVVDASASGPEPETTNGSGIALNQRFQVYATFFYNLEPAADWMFVEDGPYPVPPS